MADSLGSIAKIVGIGSAGSGIIGNIINSITRGKQVGRLEDAEKKFANMKPEELAGLVSRAQQPLSQDLLQSVGNLVQADVAGRGLAESPGVFAATETQALAPYKIEQQKMALELVMKQLGLPIEYANAVINAAGPGTDMSKILAMLISMTKGGGGGGGLIPDVPTGAEGITGDVIGQIIAGGVPTPTFPTGGASTGSEGGPF